MHKKTMTGITSKRIGTKVQFLVALKGDIVPLCVPLFVPKSESVLYKGSGCAEIRKTVCLTVYGSHLECVGRKFSETCPSSV